MAALYDPRYDYPNHLRQSYIASIGDLDRRNAYLRKLHPDTVPPVPALQTGAYAPEMPIDDFAEPPLTEAQKHARNNIPAVAMYYNENGDLVPAGTASINAYQGNIVSDNTGADGNYTPDARAALLGPTANEIRDNRRSGILMNQDPARYAPDGSDLDDGMGNIYSLEGGDKDDVFQSLVKRYLDEGLGREEAIAKADEQMKKPALQLFKENTSALASSINTSVLAAGSDGSGSNRLTNLLSGLTYDALGYLTGTSAEAVKANGISLRVDGDEFFAFDGENTVPIDAKTAEAIEAANGDNAAQAPSQQNPPMGMSFNAGLAQPPALTDPSTDTKAPQTDKGVLTDPVSAKPTQSTVRSTTGGYTGNARGSDLPDMQIGLNERLMRMGAAGLAAGGQGSLAQMGAMFGASANVNQLNRQAEMEAFGIEEERRQAHAARVAALAASKNKGADAETGAASTSARIALDNANAVLKGFDDFDGVTGPFNWFVSGWDSSGFGDAGRANVRLKIAKMKVDSTLARVAETKGAISEKEMEIFESDQPSFYASEDVWREWVTNYIRALNIMHTNLSTGQTPYKNGGGGGSTGGGADFAGADKLVGI